MLTVLDERWKDHLYDLDQLRNAIQYRAWGQKDPLVEYKREAFEMFEDLMHDIQSTFTERFLKIQVSAERARAAAGPAAATADGDRAPVRADERGRRPVHGDAAAGGPAAARAGPTPTLTSSHGPLARATAAVPEVGRNDPCPCGSGKKYKKCHGVGR